MSTKLQIGKLCLKNIQPLFSEKRRFANKISLENSEENIISDYTLVSEQLKNFFQNVTESSKY